VPTSIPLPDPVVVILIGAAGSGKSTWAASQFSPTHIVSSDALRAVVGRDESDLGASEDAFDLLFTILEARLKRRLTSVIDTTGLDDGLRSRVLAMSRKHELPCHAVLLMTPLKLAKVRNAQRAKRVPEAIVTDQVHRVSLLAGVLDKGGFDRVHRIEPEPDDELATGRAKPKRSAATKVVVRGKKMGMRFGLQISAFPWPAHDHAQRITEIAQAAEDAGFDSIWVMDHFRQIPQLGREWDDMYEATTTLAHLAAVTTRVTLGTLVVSATHRNTGVLGKAMATLDVLSGGRAVCGIGLGWFKAEHDAYGIEFPSVSDRYSLLEDALQALPLLWGEGSKEFRGKRFEAEALMGYPRPLQARIPLLVGGSGERRTLQLVAKYADACNLFGEPAIVTAKLDALYRHCDEFERDRSEIEVTHLSRAIVADHSKQLAEKLTHLKVPRRSLAAQHPGTVTDHINRVVSLQQVGVAHTIVSLPGITPEDVERYGSVIAGVRLSNI
jgi:F420-dependent oxidoreductase-like protein